MINKHICSEAKDCDEWFCAHKYPHSKVSICTDKVCISNKKEIKTNCIECLGINSMNIVEDENADYSTHNRARWFCSVCGSKGLKWERKKGRKLFACPTCGGEKSVMIKTIRPEGEYKTIWDDLLSRSGIN